LEYWPAAVDTQYNTSIALSSNTSTCNRYKSFLLIIPMTATVSYLGEVNKTGGQSPTYAQRTNLFLKLFTGEVYEAFRNSTIAKDLVMNRTLRGGKQAQFIHTGRISAGYRTPGVPILGSGNPPAAETTIALDDLLVASAFVDNLDEIMSQYDIRGPIARQIGQSLAEFYDRRIFRVLDRASAATAAVTGEPGGFQINLGASKEYDAQALVDGFFEAAARLDEVAAPKDGRVAVLSPRQYYALISQVDTNILNRDYGAAGGSLNSGDGLYEIAGISIKKSNNIPFLGKYGSASGTAIDAAAVTGENNTYGIATDFTNSCGLIFHRDAAGVVEAIGPSVQTTGADTKVIYQGDVITEIKYPFTPDANDEIVIPDNVLQLSDNKYENVQQYQTVLRGGKLYDKISHSFTSWVVSPVLCDVVWLFAFEDLPQVFQDYITQRAARVFAGSVVGSEVMFKFNQQDEGLLRANCIAYDTNTSEVNIFGVETGQNFYISYTPFRTIAR
jgi:hypothetical protein